MNCSVYLFGILSSGYTQYPDEEFSATIFQTFYQRAKAPTQIAIHRDGHLMYYCYIRKLEQSQYIGLCVLLNDALITGFNNMFSLFEKTISDLAENGYLIRYNENGDLVANIGKLFNKPEDIDFVIESLKQGFKNLASTAKKLPPENFAVSKDSTKEFTIEDDPSNILASSYINGYTYIYKSKNFNTARITSFKGILANVTKENEALKKDNIILRNKVLAIKRQKKQFQYVIILFIAVIICGIGLLMLNDSLNLTQSKLDDANDSILVKDLLIIRKDSIITQKTDSVHILSSNISRLQSLLADERTKRESAEQELENIKSDIKSSLPILITSIEIANIDANNNIITNYGYSIHSSNTMYLSPRIKYTGIRSGESITLYVKFYTENGSLSTSSSSPTGYSYSNSIKIDSGSDNTAYLSGWGSNNRGHWPKGTYRFEIWHGAMCLKSKTFTVN